MATTSRLVQAVSLTGQPLTGEQDPFVRRFLDAVTAAHGTKVDVISGYRSPEHNAAVGGAKSSNHTRGLALDSRAFIPGQGWIPGGDLPTLGQFGLRSGDQPGFFNGKPDPNHVDAGYMATSVAPASAPAAPAAGSSPLAAVVGRELAKFPQLDPQAVLAVSAQEGLGGGVGDNGTSFGPFQLHQGGALPASVPLAGAQQWATSPAGIDYALGRIQSVAAGLKGPAAVNAIVRKFERPANPGAEVAGALRSYGTTPAAAAAHAQPLAAAVSAPTPAKAKTSPLLQLALQLLKS